jgi:hypothetical protein
MNGNLGLCQSEDCALVLMDFQRSQMESVR